MQSTSQPTPSAAPNLPASGSAERAPERRRAETTGTEDFAALYSALRAGYGAAVLATRVNASAGEAFTGATATDARQRRLEQMTQAARDEARTAGARGAGLSDAPETTELGGRAQRLGAEKDAAADGRGARVRMTATARNDVAVDKTASTADVRSAGAPAARDATPRPAASGATEPTERPAPPSATPAAPRTEAKVSANATPPMKGARDAATPGGATSAARVSPASAAAVAAKPAPTLARQIAQFLGTRLAGPAVRPADGATAVRGDSRANPSASSTTRGAPEAAARGPARDEALPTDFARVVRNVRLQVGAQQSTAKIRLHPPELGQVRVDVKLIDSRIELRVEAENPVARELLAERLETLRSALQEHGLVADKVELVDPRDPPAYVAPEGGRDQDPTRETFVADRQAEQRRDSTTESAFGGSAPMAELTTAESASVTARDARLDIRI
jgi:flagellar hook-length control protein FliK